MSCAPFATACPPVPLRIDIPPLPRDMTDKLAEFANKDTPSDVYVPCSWPALILWAIGKFGIGVVFAAMLVPVYLDLRTSNAAMVDVARASAEAMHTLATKVELQTTQLDRLTQDLRASGIQKTPDRYSEE